MVKDEGLPLPGEAEDESAGSGSGQQLPVRSELEGHDVGLFAVIEDLRLSLRVYLVDDALGPGPYVQVVPRVDRERPDILVIRIEERLWSAAPRPRADGGV